MKKRSGSDRNDRNSRTAPKTAEKVPPSTQPAPQPKDPNETRDEIIFGIMEVLKAADQDKNLTADDLDEMAEKMYADRGLHPEYGLDGRIQNVLHEARVKRANKTVTVKLDPSVWGYFCEASVIHDCTPEEALEDYLHSDWTCSWSNEGCPLH